MKAMHTYRKIYPFRVKYVTAEYPNGALRMFRSWKRASAFAVQKRGTVQEHNPFAPHDEIETDEFGQWRTIISH